MMFVILALALLPETSAYNAHDSVACAAFNSGLHVDSVFHLEQFWLTGASQLQSACVVNMCMCGDQC